MTAPAETLDVQTAAMLHTHRCPSCGEQINCAVMICRGRTESTCFACKRRGIE